MKPPLTCSPSVPETSLRLVLTQASLPCLRDLDLYNCAVTKVENYREGVFQLLPTLKYLDGSDENENEKDDDDDDDENEDDDDDDDNDDDLLSSEVGEDEDDFSEDEGLEDEDDLGDDGDFGEDDDASDDHDVVEEDIGEEGMPDPKRQRR